MQSRIQLAKKDIESFFDDQLKEVFKTSELRDIFNNNNASWRLKKTETPANFIRDLCKISNFKKVVLNFPNRTEVRYIWKDVSIYKVLMEINPTCYFSHYTAMFFNGLTEQIPKTIFLNTEQTPKVMDYVSDIEQKNIDTAFRNKSRETKNITEYKEFKIYHLSGKFTNNLGVIEIEVPEIGKVRTTNIERTLIDITVRSIYSGGVFEVKKAYEFAKDKVSVNKLVSYLKKINYKYPYHQAIGFYLEKASYSQNQLNLVEEFERTLRFYLDYKMTDFVYDSKWNVYYPRGL